MSSANNLSETVQAWNAGHSTGYSDGWDEGHAEGMRNGIRMAAIVTLGLTMVSGLVLSLFMPIT